MERIFVKGVHVFYDKDAMSPYTARRKAEKIIKNHRSPNPLRAITI